MVVRFLLPYYSCLGTRKISTTTPAPTPTPPAPAPTATRTIGDRILTTISAQSQQPQSAYHHFNNNDIKNMSNIVRTRTAERLAAAANKVSDKNRSDDLAAWSDKYKAFAEQLKPFIVALKNYHASLIRLEHNRSEVSY
jgi:predicted component of type VI protein secretion system